MANKTVVFNFTELYLQDSFKPLVCISPSARCVILFKVTLTFVECVKFDSSGYKVVTTVFYFG